MTQPTGPLEPVPHVYATGPLDFDATVTGPLAADETLAGDLAGLSGALGLPEDDIADAGLSHYELNRTLGAGAMGEIWLARDSGLRRRVAYKRMHAHIAQHQSAMARFLREMQITAQLDHPNIVPVYECELNPDGSLAYAMKLVKGRTLKDVLVAKKQSLEKGDICGPEFSLERLLEYFLSVCDALAFAHSKGVIHRDLKPVNLMIGEFGEVYVMDWGIARRIGGGDSEDAPSEHENLDTEISVDETRAGQILGTPRYMSPQQAAGKNKELDGRSDQFALGLILFEILTLKPAFSAPTPVELLKKVLKVEIQAFEPVGGSEPIPRELKAVVLKALGRKPEERYASVVEMADDIRRWQQGLAVIASPDTPLQAAGRWIGQHRQAALAAAFGVLLLVLGAISLSVYAQQAALARQRAHSAYVSETFTAVTRQSQRIDSHLLKMQGLLDSFAGAALQALMLPPPPPEPHFPQHPFTAPNQKLSKVYGGPVSLDWATSGFSPGKTMQDMNGKLQKWLPLRHDFKQVLLRSATDQPEKLTQQEIEHLILQQGTPIVWAHVSLEEGVIYMYPGVGFNTPGYDARTRPWYKNTVGTHGARWGKPYFDPLSGAMLPCTRALYDSTGKFIGVAGIDLTFRYVIDHLLRIETPGLRRSYLLDAEGRIIIKSVDAAKGDTGSLTKGFDTPPFPDERLQAAIRAKSGGGSLEATHRILHFSRLNTLGWYYLVESEPEVQRE